MALKLKKKETKTVKKVVSTIEARRMARIKKDK